MLEPPARIHAQFVHLNCFLSGENSPADPRDLGGCQGTPHPPLWYQCLDFQVLAEQAIQRWVTQNPKEVKQEGVPKGLRVLAQEVRVSTIVFQGPTPAGKVGYNSGHPALKWCT